MKPLLVIVPSRGRPENARRLVEAWATVTHADLMLCVDVDDPTISQYPPCTVGEPAQLVQWTNREARIEANHYRFLGSMGDDHLPRTPSWDVRVCEELSRMGTGICYTNDLFQGENLPTACFMTSDIVTALGYMAPPILRHQYCDNAWKAWGTQIGRLTYLEDVIIEHMHPAAGKASHDTIYGESDGLMDRDAKAFETYLQTDFMGDILALRRLAE